VNEDVKESRETDYDEDEDQLRRRARRGNPSQFQAFSDI
jgi:hypothetical protein